MSSGVWLAAALVLASTQARAGSETIAAVRITAETDVAAPPAKVWAQLTHGRNLATWCPSWKSARNATAEVARVGDVLDYTDQWGNGGRSIVTYLTPQRELRVAHEPADGSYMCQARVQLSAAGGGTHVRWVEQYTDESAAKDRDATAHKMIAETNAMLSRLKAAAER